MIVVVDASVVVALLVDTGSAGGWAEQALRGHDLAAPALMPAEVANVLRRNAANGRLNQDFATLAHDRLLDLPVTLFPFPPLAGRAWELRAGVSSYDAWYVALAESLDAPLVTLDERLTRATGPRCRFLTLPLG